MQLTTWTTKFPRRKFLHLAASAAVLPTMARIARAEAYPLRPVKILVPFAAGGPTDVVARILADLLSARWAGQSVIIENRPGAGTIVATAVVAKAAADGYTLLVASNALLINPAIGQKPPMTRSRNSRASAWSRPSRSHSSRANRFPRIHSRN